MESHGAAKKRARREQYAANKDSANARRRASYSARVPANNVISPGAGPSRAPALVGTSSFEEPHCYTQLECLPTEPWTLPDALNCVHCGAARFYRETPSFCCANGHVVLSPITCPDSLRTLLLGNTDISIAFRTYIRTYNNAFAFTSLGVKYDKALCRNDKNVYTFRVQGMVHHFISDLVPSTDRTTNLQLYFFDTSNELDHRMAVSNKFQLDIVSLLVDILRCNPYATFFRSLRDVPSLDEFTIALKCDPSFDQRTFNLPTADQVAAIWKDSVPPTEGYTRHIQVYTHSGSAQRVNYFYGCYDPLQYPLLFPYGQQGWHVGIQRGRLSPTVAHNRSSASSSASLSVPSTAAGVLADEESALTSSPGRGTFVSAREYYCFRLQIRAGDESILLQGGRLFQQWVTDQYIKVETQRLDYFRFEQRQRLYRSETLQGIVDSIGIDGVNDPNQVGQPTVLPASFIGGPRDMRKRYLDAMALVQMYGKPDFFLTMTCNPKWPEIQKHMLQHELPQNRPDLVSRAFRARLQELQHDLIKKHLLGEVAAYSFVIEFQKRGLPHTHWLLIMKDRFKIQSCSAYDRFISAELPAKTEQPYLYSLVVRHMMHGPCGTLNPANVCMRQGCCKNHFPKCFTALTSHTPNSYPSYRRRDNGSTALVRKHLLDNRWVVPYCPYLLAKFDCHINLEICTDIRLVKYLYKYIYKGHDKVSYRVGVDTSADDRDEIKNYQIGRWISPPEACWRLFGFPMSEIHPAVVSLQLHLPNYQYTSFKTTQPLTSVISNPLSSKTMLTEFFHMNATDERAKKLNLLYREYPQYFVWDNKIRKWRYRKKGFAIGRIVSANPIEGERYFSRLLLQSIRCPDSFGCLKRSMDTELDTFRDAALALGLLESDAYLESSLAEASLYEMPHALRRLFATILVYCSPGDPQALWNKFKLQLTEDLCRHSSFDHVVEARGLQHIADFLVGLGRNIQDFAIIPPCLEAFPGPSNQSELLNEKQVAILADDLESASLLNPGQRKAFDIITTCVYTDAARVFFVDGPAGTGKTFLYRALLAAVRYHDHVAIAVATSGVAASLLPGGRTAHSRFKIPIDLDSMSLCKVSKQSGLAKLLIACKLILWDEISMARGAVVEALDGMLRDVTNCVQPFGGKVIVFGGDFRQIAPVVPNGQKEDMISASFVSSPLFKGICRLQLRDNMRARQDPEFAHFLQTVGDGLAPQISGDRIALPHQLVFPYTDLQSSLEAFIDEIFPNLQAAIDNPLLIVNRAILCPTNEAVDKINEMLISKLPGSLRQYFSSDVTKEPCNQSQYEDFLNALSPAGLPPHTLNLKVGSPIILLRNLNPGEGLCNGTRLICRSLQPRIIHAEISTGPFKGKETFIPRIPLECTDLTTCPVPFVRTQFPVKLCFSMTINKSQGQTLEVVGIYLREPVFTHGQLYVALSRAKTASAVRVLIQPPTVADPPSNVTSNIVYAELLHNAQHCSVVVS